MKYAKKNKFLYEIIGFIFFLIFFPLFLSPLVNGQERETIPQIEQNNL